MVAAANELDGSCGKMEKHSALSARMATNWVILSLCFSSISYYINHLFFPTSAFIEIFILVNFVILFLFQRSRMLHLPSRVVTMGVWAMYSVAIITYLLLISVLKDSGFDKELYRLLVIPVMLFSLSLLQLDYIKILRAIYILAVMAGIYEIVEIWMLNYVLSGDFTRFFLHSVLVSNDNSQYARDVNFFGLFTFLRPFGLFGETQKSPFIFAVGAMAHWYVSRSQGRKMGTASWPHFYSLMMLFFAFISDGRTGFVTMIAVYMALFGRDVIGRFGVYVFMLAVFAAIAVFFNANPVYGNPLSKDVDAFFNEGPLQIFFGAGFYDPQNAVSILGMGHEHYFMRILIQMGLLLTLVFLGFFIATISSKKELSRWKWANVLMLLLMTSHYSILNVYFVMIAISMFMLALANHRSWNILHQRVKERSPDLKSKRWQES